MRHWDMYSYHVADHFLPALINGDLSGLSDDDEKELREFEVSAHARAHANGFTVGHWADAGDSGDFRQCEISGLHAITAQVYLMVYTD